MRARAFKKEQGGNGTSTNLIISPWSLRGVANFVAKVSVEQHYCLSHVQSYVLLDFGLRPNFDSLLHPDNNHSKLGEDLEQMFESVVSSTPWL